MLSKFMAIACAMTFALAASGQNIRGRIEDSKTNEVLAGATVRVLETLQTTVSDQQGKFEIAKNSGTATLEVRFVGYQPKKVAIDNVQQEWVIRLDVDARITEEVVVYATRADDKTPTTYTNIGKKELQAQNFGQDLPFLLNWTPSLITTSDAGAGVGYTGMRIRGSDATRINVTINGVPYNDAESQNTFWVDIPDIASSTQSIQVQRGVGTSTNGGSAFGASVNLQTNLRNEDAYGEVVNAVGSFNTRRHTFNFGSGLLAKNWVVDGRVSKIVSDGFIDRASSDLSSYYFSAGHFTDKTILKAVVFGGSERTYQSWYGVPESRLTNNAEAMQITASNEGWNEEQLQNLLNSNSRTFNIYTYENQVDDYKQDHYQLHTTHRFSEFVTASSSLHYTYGRGFYEQYQYNDEFENYGIPDVTIGDSIVSSTDIVRRRWLDNHFYGITYSVTYEKDKVNAIVGGAWNRYVGDHFGRIVWAEVVTVPFDYQYYFSQGDKKDFSAYLKVNYELVEDLQAFVDLQARSVNYETAGTGNELVPFAVNADFNFFNPKAGLRYALANNQFIYSSLSWANREPVRDDFVDNPGTAPRSERLMNLETGYRKESSKFVLQANVYWMKYNDQLVLTGALNDVGAVIRTNVDKSYRLGLEVESAWKISNRLTWAANLAISRNKINEFAEVLYDYGLNYDTLIVVERMYRDTDISFSPNLVAGSVLSFNPVQSLQLSLLTKYVGRQYLDNTSNNARSLRPYFVNDLRLNFVWKPALVRQVDISFLVNNLLNEEYESNGYTYGYLGGGEEFRENFYYPQAGRHFMAMVSIKF